MFRKSPNHFERPMLELLSRVYFDTETSGLNEGEHVILSLALIVDKHTGEAGYPHVYEEADRLDLVIVPTEEEWERAHPKALEINGMTWEFLEENGVPFKEAERVLLSFVQKNNVRLNKAHLVGQNPSFDIRFIRHFFPALEFMNFPFTDVTDNIQYAKHLQDYDFTFSPTNFKSAELSIALGVEPESDIHTAMGGAEVVRRNYLAIRERFDEVFKKMRQAAQKGVNYPDEFPEVQAVDPELSYVEKFAAWAEGEGWKRMPDNHLHFVDPQGFRWSWFSGFPNILVKLNK